MNLLFDMNMPPAICELFAGSKHKANHWSTVGRFDSPDSEILAWAARESYIIITRDLDFGNLLALGRSIAPSIVLNRQFDVAPPAVYPILMEALVAFENELEKGALIVIDENKTRIRILPI